MHAAAQVSYCQGLHKFSNSNSTIATKNRSTSIAHPRAAIRTYVCRALYKQRHQRLRIRNMRWWTNRLDSPHCDLLSKSSLMNKACHLKIWEMEVRRLALILFSFVLITRIHAAETEAELQSKIKEIETLKFVGRWFQMYGSAKPEGVDHDLQCVTMGK